VITCKVRDRQRERETAHKQVYRDNDDEGLHKECV